ncbi:MAG TPA: DUF2922 domain-containing protein [Clostridiales bacterium]|jgi:hypothetical protein|nr:DUF2922 domain-containing protein [Clostridiales bacterium]
MNRRLELVFNTGAGKTYKITVDAPKENLMPSEVSAAMNAILNADIFNVEGGLAGIAEASIVTTERQVIDLT